MSDGFWTRRMQEGDVGPARSHLSRERLEATSGKLAHLCRVSEWSGAKVASSTHHTPYHTPRSHPTHTTLHTTPLDLIPTPHHTTPYHATQSHPAPPHATLL